MPYSTTQRASIAALTRSANTDPKAMTAAARASYAGDKAHLGSVFIDRARAAAPPGTPEPEIIRRAWALRKVSFARLSAAGVAARKKKGRVPMADDPSQPGEPR